MGQRKRLTIWSLVAAIALVGCLIFFTPLRELSCLDKTFLATPEIPQVYVANVDGSGARRIDGGYTVNWNPRGDRIAYTALPQIGVVVVDPEGRGGRRVGSGDHPVWSPEGSHLALGVAGGIGIAPGDTRDSNWVVRPGADPNWVIKPRQPGDYEDKYPAGWSPDGTEILFWTPQVAGGEIFIINRDGSGRTLIVRGRDPAWSPDGSRIAFAADRDQNFDVYTINRDGSGERRLTSHYAADRTPAWSSDGTRIAFASNRYCDSDIFVMDADGNNVTRLLKTTAEEESPTWSPDGARLAYVVRPNPRSEPARKN